jgi:hypothetical protein
LAAEDIEVVFDQPPGVSAFFKTLSLSGMSRSRMSLSRISIILGNITSTLVDKLVDLVYGGDSSKISAINYVGAKLQFRGPSTLWGATLPDTCWIITDLVEGAFNIHRQSHLSPRHDQMVVVSPTSITVYGEHDVGLVGPISAKGWKDVDPYKARDIHHCFDRTDGGKEKEREKMECNGVDVVGAPASTSARRPAPIEQPHDGGGGESRNLNHQRRHQRCHYPHRPTHPYLQVPYFRPQAGSITTTSRSNSNILSCRFNYESFSTIAVDSTAFADADPETNVIGSKIESALLKLAKELGWADYKTEGHGGGCPDVFVFVRPFPVVGYRSTTRKALGAVL